MKTNAIKDFVVSSRPHVWVINETKPSSPVASCVSVPSYNMYETPALRCSSRSSKWGVVAAVRNDLHGQRVPVPGLAGRVIALDLIIPTASARGYILRVLVVYAPWDPGGPQPTPSQFWSMVHGSSRTLPALSVVPLYLPHLHSTLSVLSPISPKTMIAGRWAPLVSSSLTNDSVGYFSQSSVASHYCSLLDEQ